MIYFAEPEGFTPEILDAAHQDTLLADLMLAKEWLDTFPEATRDDPQNLWSDMAYWDVQDAIAARREELGLPKQSDEPL